MHFFLGKKRKIFNTFKIHTKEEYRKVSYMHIPCLQTPLQMTAIPLKNLHLCIIIIFYLHLESLVLYIANKQVFLVVEEEEPLVPASNAEAQAYTEDNLS